MSDELLDSYVDAWLKHVAVSDSSEGEQNLEAFLSTLSPEVVYEDVPSGNRFDGHEGASQMSTRVSNLFDMTIAIESKQTDGERFAFEFTCDATMKATGDAFAFKAVAVGAFSNGKVVLHRDYYDGRTIPRPPQQPS